MSISQVRTTPNLSHQKQVSFGKNKKDGSLVKEAAVAGGFVGAGGIVGGLSSLPVKVTEQQVDKLKTKFQKKSVIKTLKQIFGKIPEPMKEVVSDMKKAKTTEKLSEPIKALNKLVENTRKDTGFATKIVERYHKMLGVKEQAGIEFFEKIDKALEKKVKVRKAGKFALIGSVAAALLYGGYKYFTADKSQK